MCPSGGEDGVIEIRPRNEVEIPSISTNGEGTTERLEPSNLGVQKKGRTSEKDGMSISISEKERSVSTSKTTLTIRRKSPTELLTHQGMTASEFCRWCPKMQEEIAKGKVIVKSPQIDEIRASMNRDLEDSDCMPEWALAICVTCRDGKGKSDGVIKLRSPFYSYYYLEQHCESSKHRGAVSHKNYMDELVRKGKVKKQHQGTMSSYFMKSSKKSDPPSDPPAASGQKKMPAQKTKRNIHCVGVVNSCFGKKRHLSSESISMVFV